VDNLTRFYQRNLPRFAQAGGTLFLDPPPQAGALLRDLAQARAFTQDFAHWRVLTTAGLPCEFGSFPAPEPGLSGDIVLNLPREKQLLDAWLCWCAAALPPANSLWLAGENRAGIKSAPRLLDQHFGQVSKRDNARHCALFEAREATGAGAFDEDRLFEQWAFEIRGQTFTGCSMPGVFAHGRLDPGTRLLLETLDPAELTGDVLDFGCGAGVIAAVLKSVNPALNLTLVDNNALALASSRRTLAANGATGQVQASDGLSEVSGQFDLVVSNPPFHRGVATESDMSTEMLRSIRNFLNPGGQLVLVVNRHLPYRTWLDDLFGGHGVLAESARYHVLRAPGNQ
jgi:16S rRNA (guanine1207-N2)-methyltransferase